MQAGEFFIDDSPVELNIGRRTLSLSVANTSNRPIQVGSHYHFAEVNAALAFDRSLARGMRLNVAAGSTVVFSPGQTLKVELVDYAGERYVFGFSGQVMGKL